MLRSYEVRVPGAAPIPNRNLRNRGTERMGSKTLSKRVEQLETRMMPAGEPIFIEIQFVSADGSIASRLRVNCGVPAIGSPARLGRPGRRTR